MTASTPADLTAQLKALGVAHGGVLLVHTSFRAVRPVDGGPLGLIRALQAAIGPEGTLVMPGWGGDEDTPFDPARDPVAEDLGVTAEVFRRQPGTLRADHCQAFLAAGPKAAQILADPLPLPPHIPASPVGRVRDLDGQVLLLGVGHDADTSLHLAEIEGGAPYRTPKYCTILQGGVPTRVDFAENDHCCARFALADDWLRAKGLQAEGRVGNAEARLIAARDIVATAVEHLAADPLIFLHSPGACEDCDEARASLA